MRDPLSVSYPKTAAVPEATRPAMGWVLLPTILASSMAFIDGTALNVALPALQADLGASGVQLLWILNAYLLFLSSLILLGGSLGDRYGRKRTFMVGIAIFALASTACGLSPSAEMLIAARTLQGVGGALTVPGSLAVLTSCVAQEKRGQAIGTWSAFTTVTTIVGPVLGGVLASAGFWRGVFFINVPLAVMALAVLAWKVPETTDEHTQRLDWLGAGLATFGLAGVTFAAIEGPELGLLHPLVLASAVTGAGSLVAFLVAEARVRSPMVPLSLFRNRTFSGANVLTFLLYAGLTAVFFFFSLALIQSQGYSARAAGFAVLPFVFSLALLSRWAGALADRMGPRPLLIAGPALTALGFAGMGMPGLGTGPADYWTHYLPVILLAGAGMGLTVAPLTTAVMTSLPDRNVGVASGVNNAVARSAGVLAIAFLGGFGLLTFRQELAGRAALLPLTSEQQATLMVEADDLGDAQPPPHLDAALRSDVERAIRGSLLTAFRRTALVCGGLAGLGALIAGVWLEPRVERDGKGEEANAPAEDRPARGSR